MYSNKSGIKQLKRSKVNLEEIDNLKRIVNFVVMTILGLTLQLGSCFRFLASENKFYPSNYALAYLTGSLLLFIGLIKLAGFKTQYSSLADPSTFRNTAIFLISTTLCSLFLTLNSTIVSKFAVITLLCAQMLAYSVYSLSHVKKAIDYLRSSPKSLSK